MIYWIDADGTGSLGIMPHPRGGEALAGEIAALQSGGAGTVVSLLTSEEIKLLGLDGERVLCEASGIGYLWLPITDMGVPSSDREAGAMIAMLASLLDAGRRIVLHCHGGIGRSGMIAAAVMVWRGADVDDAFARIAAARGCRVPETPEQHAWVAGRRWE